MHCFGGFGRGYLKILAVAIAILKSHRCQPSRNRAGNPAFFLERPTFLAIFRDISKIETLSAPGRHFVRNSGHYKIFVDTVVRRKLFAEITSAFHTLKSMLITDVRQRSPA